MPATRLCYKWFAHGAQVKLLKTIPLNHFYFRGNRHKLKTTANLKRITERFVQVKYNPQHQTLQKYISLNASIKNL